MKRLNIIGAGHVSKTLGALWHRAGVLQIGDVLNTSHASAREAVASMQGGQTGFGANSKFIFPVG